MVIFEIRVELQNGVELPVERNARRNANAEFQIPSQKVFAESRKRCCLFLSRVRDDGSSAVIGAFGPDRACVERYLPRFLKHSGLLAGAAAWEEITISALRSMLRNADREDYIDDEDMFLEPFRLDDFMHAAPHYLDYTEELIGETASPEQLRKKARQLACEETLLPELERILQGAARPGIAGQPVHYLIRSDEDKTRRQMTDLLAAALLGAGRIRNRRLGFLSCDEDADHHREYLDLAFQYGDGGALVIDLKGVSDGLSDGESAQAGMETVQTVCDCVREHRNRVLTVLSLPRTGETCRSLLRDKLGDVPVVELQEDILFGEASVRFLRRVARESGVRAPRSLMKQLDDPEKGWLPGDLRAVFDRWFSGYLRESVYPQYAALETAAQETAKAKPVGSAYGELESMIGLKGAKEVIRQALDYSKARKLFRDRGVMLDTPSMHMVFTGNPGTAKTTAARLFARIMKENGVLSHGNLIEVGRGDLVGKYVGWTAKAVQRKFREAKGGVLFIDEAYSLLDGQENSYGDEAINTIVQEMENCRDSTVVIFAGYPGPMEEFLARNPGLRSRIAFHVPFEDYSEEELYSIAELLASAKGLRLGPGVREKLLPILRESMRAPDFGNGRFARGLVEKAAMLQASRLLRADVDNLTDRELRTLLPEDFAAPAAPKRAEPRRIGFSVA